jgi:hypothetical protein
MRGKVDSWNQVGNRVDPCPIKCYIVFKAGIDFSSPVTTAILFACWPIGVLSPQTQHMTTTILKSSIPSCTRNLCLQESVPQQNQFLTRNQFRGIDAWGPKSVKIRAQERKIKSFGSKDDIMFYLCSEGTAEARLLVWRISSEASWVLLLARLCKVKYCSLNGM